MTDIASPQADSKRSHMRLTPVMIGVALCALVIAALAGFLVGRQDRTPASHTLTGRAYVGSDVASVRVDGWSYGFSVGDGSITWVDASGTEHEGGIAPCLTHPGRTTTITFGWVAASAPGGSNWRQVTWVRCGSG